MTSILAGRALAKINLVLDVTGFIEYDNIRYHAISTVMQSISLCDRIDMTISESDKTLISVSCNNPEIPCTNKNIAWRAAELYLESLGKSALIGINIEKNIPVAAGLAGGSTDAACVLRLLNRHFGNPFDKEELQKIAGRLGSDVPFCITGGTQSAIGRGEILSYLPDMPNCHIVVSIADESVSTAGAYSELDKHYNNFADYKPDECFERMIKAVSEGDSRGIYKNTFNVFEASVFPTRPGAARIKATMLSCSAKTALLSGSGPSVFGIFDKKSDADNAVKMLTDMGMRAYLTGPQKLTEDEI